MQIPPGARKGVPKGTLDPQNPEYPFALCKMFLSPTQSIKR